eukprot:TRINITY_DN8582_c0_g1_i8.p1 TRINITY_DN8582_c0_g1~~TRINITY_DN8582_c0_g1_i8.p1  ORF type:complete len:178 (+),score=24.21 TRINITY_DN8582_c0_g1_i8:305-838(+)
MSEEQRIHREKINLLTNQVNFSRQFSQRLWKATGCHTIGWVSTHTGVDGCTWFNVPMTRGKFEWYVRIVKCNGNYITIGVSSLQNQLLSNYSGLHAGGQVVECNAGGVPIGSSFLWPSFVPGVEVKVTYDSDAQTLSFVVSGVELGVVIRDLQGELYPTISLRSEGMSVELLYFREC